MPSSSDPQQPSLPGASSSQPWGQFTEPDFSQSSVSQARTGSTQPALTVSASRQPSGSYGEAGPNLTLVRLAGANSSQPSGQYDRAGPKLRCVPVARAGSSQPSVPYRSTGRKLRCVPAAIANYSQASRPEVRACPNQTPMPARTESEQPQWSGARAEADQASDFATRAGSSRPSGPETCPSQPTMQMATANHNPPSIHVARQQQSIMQQRQAVADRHFTARLLPQAIRECQRRYTEHCRTLAAQEADINLAQWLRAQLLKRRALRAWRAVLHEPEPLPVRLKSGALHFKYVAR